jgi:hypothetical protein
MTRIWVYQRMVTNAPLVASLPGGIHQTTSILVAPHEKPFIIYRQTSDNELMRGDDGDTCRSAGYQLFVHDVAGDYLQIDSIMLGLQVLFKDTIDQPNRIIRSRWIETSDDWRDDDMGTIMKYGRIQVNYKTGVL